MIHLDDKHTLHLAAEGRVYYGILPEDKPAKRYGGDRGGGWGLFKTPLSGRLEVLM